VHAAEREDDGGKLVHAQSRKEVRLVLRIVGGTVEERPVGGGKFEARVVAGGESVEGDSHLACGMQEGAELDGLIAADAGVGGAARAVFAAEIVEHLALVFVGDGDGVVRDSHAFRDFLRLGDAFVLVGAEASGTALDLGHAGDGVVPCGHGDAHDVVALLLEGPGGERGVDSSGKPYGDGLLLYFHTKNIEKKKGGHFCENF